MLRDIKVLHLEPTDVCQAACPLCARETDPQFDKRRQHHLDMYQIMQVFNADCITKLDKMFMSGNYGDPAAGRHTLDIYREFRKMNTNIVLGMNTNGGLQNTLWWHELAHIFNQPYDYVVFSIDGLESTNHIYRKGVSWSKVMQNAEAFIASGGCAHWDMLVYQHNEHQVDACERLARDMGFKWFRVKISKRPFVGNLAAPIHWHVPQQQSRKISCHVLNEQSVYIDAQGRVSPCCWLGARQQDFVTDFTVVQDSWNSMNPNQVCIDACGTDNFLSNFDQQWRRKTAL